MKTVQQILNLKSTDVYAVSESNTVLEGLQIMTDKNISSLLIVEDKKLKGIFTERDYARKLVLFGKSSAHTPIAEVMTPEPITVLPSDSIEHCMAIMTDRHIRHLPVVKDGQLLGMVSIGDLVKFIIADQQQTISQLENYINS